MKCIGIKLTEPRVVGVDSRQAYLFLRELHVEQLDILNTISFCPSATFDKTATQLFKNTVE